MDEKLVTHYICTGGCQGVAPEAGNCQTSTCPRFGQPLEPCGCTDGLHGAATKTEESASASEPPPGQQ